MPSPPTARRFAVAALLPLAAGVACGQDETPDGDADPPLPVLPERPADAGGPRSDEMDGGGPTAEERDDDPPRLESERPAESGAVPVPRPASPAGRPADAALRARFGMAGGPCLPFGPPCPAGVGPADRCVGLPYAGFLYYGTPACDDDPLNRTWTANAAGLGEPAAARVADHARRNEAAPPRRRRRWWLPFGR